MLGLINVYALRVNLSVAMVAMVNHTALNRSNLHNSSLGECPSDIVNTTTEDAVSDYVHRHVARGVQGVRTLLQAQNMYFLSSRSSQWYGHVARMADSRPPKFVLDWIPENGRGRGPGRPIHTWKRTILNDLKLDNTYNYDKLYTKAQDRDDRSSWVALCASRHRKD